MQLLAWAMATGAPDGVATRSISSMRLRSGASSTIMAKAEVPAETLPVRGRTESVATIPVPVSPSGGRSGMPGRRAPVGSSGAAPDSVRCPASCPATATAGRMSARDQGAATASSKAAIMSASKERPSAPMGKTPEASPTPSTCRPVRRQWT